MDKTPPEILAHIAERIVDAQKWYSNPYARRWDARLAPYASVSRAWKACIERLTFKYIRVSTDELDTFATLFSGHDISRLAYISILNVRVMLPPPQNPLGCCAVVRIPDREADSVTFSAAMSKLFTILAEMEARATENCPMHLRFWEGWRHSRFQEPKGSTLVPCSDQGLHLRREILEAKAVSGQIHLVHEDAIPVVPGVTTLEFVGGSESNELSYLNTSWIPKIVQRLPDLQTLHLTTEDKYDHGRHKRHLRRESFAASIRSLAACHLREIRLNIMHSPMQNENLPVHKLVSNNQWGQEAWFKVFNHLATFPNLVTLQLLGPLVICPEFFRGIVEHPGTPFPSLVEFELQFAPETADGRWNYERDDEAIERSRSDPEYKDFWEEWQEDHDEEDQENERHPRESLEPDRDVGVFEDGPYMTDVVRIDQFRSLPEATTLAPFLIDASKAVARIPTLRKFILKHDNMLSDGADLTHYPIVSRVFELWYLKAGMHSSPLKELPCPAVRIPGDAAHINRNRLYWRVDRWKPWDEVVAAWHTLAGPDAKIVFLEEKNWTSYGGGTFRVYEGEF